VFKHGISIGYAKINNKWRTPKGQRLESHSKTFMERVFPRNKLKASCQDGERFGEWFETPSYEEGARG